jgi:hypothetical protein
VNLYRYVGNNPSNFIDPSGLVEVWTFSGVDNWDDKDHGYRSYVGFAVQSLLKPAPTIDRQYVSRLGIGLHYVTAHHGDLWLGGPTGKPSIKSLESLTSKDRLDREAAGLVDGSIKSSDKEILAGKAPRSGPERPVDKGMFCPPKCNIYAILIAPKTRTKFTPKPCCKLTASLYWSPFDGVPNQGPGAGESPEWWKEVLPKATIYAVRPGPPIPWYDWGKLFDTFRSHALDLFLEGVTPVVKTGAIGNWQDAEMATGRAMEIPQVRDVFTRQFRLAKASASGAPDYIFVCHSQGCNIMMHVLNKGCTA